MMEMPFRHSVHCFMCNNSKRGGNVTGCGCTVTDTVTSVSWFSTLASYYTVTVTCWGSGGLSGSLLIREVSVLKCPCARYQPQSHDLHMWMFAWMVTLAREKSCLPLPQSWLCSCLFQSLCRPAAGDMFFVFLLVTPRQPWTCSGKMPSPIRRRRRKRSSMKTLQMEAGAGWWCCIASWWVYRSPLCCLMPRFLNTEHLFNSTAVTGHKLCAMVS